MSMCILTPFYIFYIDLHCVALPKMCKTKLNTPEVKSTPLIGLPSTSALINQNPHKTNYVFIMVDPGVYNNTGTIDALHYIQTDLRLPSPLLSSDIITIHTNTTFYPLRSHKAALAPYIAPDLTVGEAVHKYTQLLFRQPEKFTVPEEYKKFMPRNLKNPLNRAGFPLGEFVDRTGLGEPVAGNYFDVLKVIGGTDGNGKGSSAGAMSDVWSGNRKVIVQIVLILAAWALW